MGWPFQSSSHSKNKEMKATSSRPGFLGKLLGNAKQDEKTQAHKADKPTLPTAPASQWDLPEASFDAVAKLLEETRQKAPNQPLPTNPYRSSLSLEDDEPAGVAETPQELAKEEHPPNWAFDPSQLSLERQVKNGSGEIPVSFMPGDQHRTLVDTEGADVSEDPAAVSLGDIPTERDFEPADDEHSLDDFGLNALPQALPQGSSLKQLMDNNVLTFITSNPITVQGFKVQDGLGQTVREPVEEITEPGSLSLEPSEYPSFDCSSDIGLTGAENEPASVDTGETVSDAWFNGSGVEANQDLFAMEPDSAFELSVHSVEALSDEDFSDSAFELPAEGGVFLRAVSENSFVHASDNVVTESSWPEQGLSTSDAEDGPYSLDFETLSPLDLEPLAYEDEEAFEVISLDSEENTSDAGEEEFFSDKYQFSLDSLDENEAALESDEAVWYGFDEAEAAPAQFDNQGFGTGDGVIEFQSQVAPTEPVTLDLDEDITSYQEFLECDAETGDEDVFELNDNLSSVALETAEMLQMAPESIEDISPKAIESHFTAIDEACLEPPPIVPGETPAFGVEKPLSAQMVTFEANVLLQETRFTKNSIDRLVNRYFHGR